MTGYDIEPKSSATVLGLSTGERALLLVGSPLVAAGVGLALPWVADLAAGLSWIPAHDLVEMVADLDRRIAVAVLAAIGVLAGLAFAWYAISDTPTVTVSDRDTRVDRHDESRTIDRADVRSVFVDGKQLVMLDGQSRQLLRQDVEGGRSTARAAFEQHRYPWVDSDPFDDLYRRWVPDSPDLTPSANALMKVREKALEAKTAADVTEYRDEIQKLGYVVRDKGTAQYWRPLVHGSR